MAKVVDLSKSVCYGIREPRNTAFIFLRTYAECRSSFSHAIDFGRIGEWGQTPPDYKPLLIANSPNRNMPIHLDFAH